MATITGSGGTLVTLNAGSNDQNGTAAAVTTAISNQVRAGTVTLAAAGQNPPSGLGLSIITTPNSNTQVQPAIADIVVATGGATTVRGAQGTGQFVLADNGNFTFAAGPNSGGTIVTGDGNDVVNLPNAGSLGYNVTTGSGNDTISALSGNNTIAAGGGNNVIFTGNGNDSVTLSGFTDVVNGSGSTGGSDTIYGGNGTAVIAEGAGNLLFAGGFGAATVLAGTGSDTLFAGLQGGLYQGGSAGNNVILGSQYGNSTLVGGGNNDLLIARGQGFTVLQAGAGNESLTGGATVFGPGSTVSNVYLTGSGTGTIQGGTGNDTIFAGSGAYTIDGGAGADRFTFSTSNPNGRGGTAVITGFRAGEGDRIDLQGYANQGTQSATTFSGVGSQGQVFNNVGATLITLSDNTRITLVGVTNASDIRFG